MHPYPAVKTRIIHTSGSDYEIGYQHGEQCADVATVGLSKFFTDLWHHILAVADSGSGFKGSIGKAAKMLLDPVMVQALMRQVPPFARSRLKGVADATKQSERDLLIACILPDLLPVLQGWTTKLRAGQYLSVRQPSLFGCSSFVNAGKNFLIGRNLDFPGVCFWDRYQIIQTIHRADAPRVIAFTTAGNPLAGVTGINEEQIYVALHQHYSPQVSLKGQLPFVVGEQVLLRSRTLDEAIAVVKESKLASSWAFVLADGKTREAAIVERQPHKIGVRRFSADAGMTHTNFFQSQACQSAEFATSARMNWDNYCRNKQLQNRIREFGSDMDFADAAKVISDHYDPFLGQEKVSNRCISTAHNIQSLVIDPESMRMFMAEGDAPIHLRPFKEYDLGQILSGSDGLTGQSCEGFRYTDPKMDHAKQNFVLSFVEYMAGDLTKARSYCEKSLAAHWSVETALIMGILLMKAGNYSDAVDMLGQGWSDIKRLVEATPSRPVPPEYFDTGLYLARAHALAGSHSISAKLLSELSNDQRLEDSNLRRILLQNKPYTREKLDRQLPPYSIYAPVE